MRLRHLQPDRTSADDEEARRTLLTPKMVSLVS